MMRQAGRFLPQYRALRARHDFLTLCKTPSLAAEVTAQPVDILGVDAAIVFADILLVPEAMGVALRFARGDGPQLEPPVRSSADLDKLSRPDVARSLGYVFETVAEVRRALGTRVPVIGFAGTPWTVAAYLVEGGAAKSFHHLLGWSHRDPAGLARLLARIAEVTHDYLLGQIEAGAQALQLFDTWGGLLDPERFRTLALPALLRALEGLSGRVPLIYYGRGTSHLLPLLRELPIEVLSVDWRLPLDFVRAQIGPRQVLQGNLDPAALLAPPVQIERAVRALVAAGSGGPHIINLGHGMLPMTPVEHACAFVEAAKTHGRCSVPARAR